MVAGPPIGLTRKTVVDNTHTCRSTTVCKSTAGLDSSQVYPYSRCQPMPKGLYAIYEFNAELQRFKPRQNKIRTFEKQVVSGFSLIETGL